MVLTREQLEDRLAALHQASLELVQDISLPTLLEKIAQLACQQVEARYAAVGVLNENGILERFIPVGMTPEEIEGMDHPPVGRGLIGALMHAQEPVRISNIADDPRSEGFPANHPPMTTFLGVPIRQGDLQVGQIYLTDKLNGQPFSDADEQVIETLASYAGAAIAHARLYEKLEQRDLALTRRNEDLALLNDLASALASTPYIEEILNKALSRVVSYLAVEAGEVFLREESGKTLRLLLHQGSTVKSLWTRDVFPVGEGLVGLTAKKNMPCSLIIPENTERYLSRSVRHTSTYQVACFPLSTLSGVLGVLCVATKHPRLLDEREIQFLTAIASWIGTAVENARLNVQGRRLAVLEERERIGMDLHDGIIQSIYAVGLTLEHARLLLNEENAQVRRRIEQAISDLNGSIRDIRTYILDLRPRQLHEENLVDGIQRLVNEFRANSNVEVTLKGPVDGLQDLPDMNAITLFHICQEALANVAKHARARHVDIYLWTTADRALLEISDDGRGFDAQKISSSIGHGLSNMQTRVHHVGGDIEITSEPGEGTTILVWVPLVDTPVST